MSDTTMHPVRVFAPGAAAVYADVRAADATTDAQATVIELHRNGDHWYGTVPPGSRYALRVEADRPRFDHRRSLIDPHATAVWFSDTHSRDAARPPAPPNHGAAPQSIVAPWPAPRPQRRSGRPCVVYEAHVRGMTRRREHVHPGTFAAFVDELPRLAELGVSVVELMPVHQFDPDEGNYWGYMPLVFGAVHGAYAIDSDPVGAPTELAEFVSAAHDHDVEVWIDVVLNHTTEEHEVGPTYSLRGIADAEHYVYEDGAVAADGAPRYVNDAGTGNIVDAEHPAMQTLIMESLDRFADLGIDGFRFDLAAVLARSPEFVRHIGDWADERGVTLVAEPWDLARYLVGRAFPDPRWKQWNDRFRNDMRGFLRGEPGLVPAVMRRVEGSPDLFDRATTSVNFLTAHDGFTMYDLVAYDHKHNEANGWNNTDGSSNNRSWNCGWEGDVGVPDTVMTLRRRQLRNAMCLLLLSHGTPMFVAGDEFARTQHGNNNPYNQDNEISWIDWGRRDEFVAHERFVARLIELRASSPHLTSDEWWGSAIEWFGVDGCPDLAHHSRAIAWHLGDLYVMVNMWWEPLEFRLQAPGPWRVVIDTTEEAGFVDAPVPATATVAVGPRAVVVARR